MDSIEYTDIDWCMKKKKELYFESNVYVSYVYLLDVIIIRIRGWNIGAM